MVLDERFAFERDGDDASDAWRYARSSARKRVRELALIVWAEDLEEVGHGLIHDRPLTRQHLRCRDRRRRGSAAPRRLPVRARRRVSR